MLAVQGSKGDSKRLLKDTFFILMGIFAAAFGLESFLLPNVFIDGGVTGISLLVSEVTAAPLWILIVLINLPFIFMGYKVIGKQFALKTAIAILGLALTLVLIQFPEVTQDKLLVAVFGGFFLGAGIGLSIRGGSVLDGTEVLAIFLSRKWGVKIGDIIILVNVIIFLAAAYLLSIESALYSMLTYLAASKTLDFVVEGIEEYTGVTIISKKSEEIRKMIVEKMGRGLTIYEAKGGYGSQGEQNEYNVIYTVITRLEIRKLHSEIDKIDNSAFVVMSSINDTRGGMVKKRFLDS
ncbi:YitT family protein [Flagellimonas algicola]|uniref:YitT family protein n=2 Tax=Flagellimonas algicola TaxID=2583815 RepID=A0ABY2WLU1_9FLAO|nr:YitT family protein [Allomuricauda algicola]